MSSGTSKCDKHIYEVAICNCLSDYYPTQHGVNRGDALLPSVFNLALEYTIMKVQENQAALKLIGSVQVLDYADDVNVFGDDISWTISYVDMK
jgi:hypothetical protein